MKIQIIGSGHPRFIHIMSCDLSDGDTAWVAIASVLVLGMMPGLAFFEAGLLRFSNAISIMAQVVFGAMILCVMWFIFGFSFVYGDSLYGIIGNPVQYFMLIGVPVETCLPVATNIPGLSFVVFQMMFAAITPLLQTGAFAERMKFRVYIVYIIFWELFVFYPVAHWIWGGGWLSNHSLLEGKVLDFAGGIVIHTTSGIASFVTAAILGRRSVQNEKPFNIAFALIGMTFLWIGWFGFNAGSVLGSNGRTSVVIVNTQLTACLCGVIWGLASVIQHKKLSLIETMNGAVSGLAGITPASGFIGPSSAFIVASILGVVSFFAIFPLKKTGVDDALDVTVIHGLTGVIGALSIGFFSSLDINSGGANGLFYGGGLAQLGYQTLGVVATLIWSGFMTTVILKLLDKLWTAKVSSLTEEFGLDETEHGELIMDITQLAPVIGSMQ